MTKCPPIFWKTYIDPRSSMDPKQDKHKGNHTHGQNIISPLQAKHTEKNLGAARKKKKGCILQRELMIRTMTDISPGKMKLQSIELKKKKKPWQLQILFKGNIRTFFFLTKEDNVLPASMCYKKCLKEVLQADRKLHKLSFSYNIKDSDLSGKYKRIYFSSLNFSQR